MHQRVKAADYVRELSLQIDRVASLIEGAAQIFGEP